MSDTMDALTQAAQPRPRVLVPTAPEPEGGSADPAPVPASNRKPSRNARRIRPLSI